jgi:hypothetical protein
MSVDEAADHLELEIVWLVREHFSLDERIKRARRYRKRRRHLTHFRKLVKLASLKGAA